jgi:hypothetical protein
MKRSLGLLIDTPMPSKKDEFSYNPVGQFPWEYKKELAKHLIDPPGHAPSSLKKAEFSYNPVGQFPWEYRKELAKRLTAKTPIIDWRNLINDYF